MALKFGRKKSMGPGDPAIKVGTRLPALSGLKPNDPLYHTPFPKIAPNTSYFKKKPTYTYAVKKVAENKRDPKDRMWNNPRNWEWSRTPTKPKPTPKASPKTKPAPKKPIKYTKGGKVIGTSKYKQGEGKLGVSERFKRDKK